MEINLELIDLWDLFIIFSVGSFTVGLWAVITTLIIIGIITLVSASQS